MVEKFTNATQAFGDWWNSFSVIDIVLTPFNYLKDTAVTMFDNLYNAVTELFSFDLVGKISDTIGNVISSVWNFFKELPSKAVDLIADFLPDSLKGFFKSMFGGGSTQPAQTASNTRTQTEAIPNDRNVVPTIQATAQTASLSPPPELSAQQTGRDQVFNQQSARMSVEQSQPPIIINNSTNTNSGGGANQNSPPRTSGAVQTSPQSSHIDRALYGNYFGAGVA
jgi:hypothetical protein